MICLEIRIPWNTHSDATLLTADYVFVFVLSALYISILLSCFCVYQAIFSTPFFPSDFPWFLRDEQYASLCSLLRVTVGQYHAFLWFSFPDSSLQHVSHTSHSDSFHVRHNVTVVQLHSSHPTIRATASTSSASIYIQTLSCDVIF